MPRCRPPALRHRRPATSDGRAAARSTPRDVTDAPHRSDAGDRHHAAGEGVRIAPDLRSRRRCDVVATGSGATLSLPPHEVSLALRERVVAPGDKALAPVGGGPAAVTPRAFLTTPIRALRRGFASLRAALARVVGPRALEGVGRAWRQGRALGRGAPGRSKAGRGDRDRSQPSREPLESWLPRGATERWRSGSIPWRCATSGSMSASVRRVLEEARGLWSSWPAGTVRISFFSWPSGHSARLGTT